MVFQKNSSNGNDTMTNGIGHRLTFLYLNKSSFKKFVKWQLHNDKFYWSSLNLFYLYKSKNSWSKKVMTNFIGNRLTISGHEKKNSWNEMMQFVLIFYGKWGLLDVVKSENNGICVVLTRDQWHLVTTRDPKKLPL